MQQPQPENDVDDGGIHTTTSKLSQESPLPPHNNNHQYNNDNSNSNNNHFVPNYFEHLTLGRVFSRTLNIFWDHCRLYLTLSVVVILPAALLNTLLGLLFGTSIVRAVQHQVLSGNNGGNNHGSSSSSYSYNDYNNDNDNNYNYNTMDHKLYMTGLSILWQQYLGSVITLVCLQWAISTVITLTGKGAMVRVCAETYAGWLPPATSSSSTFAHQNPGWYAYWWHWGWHQLPLLLGACALRASLVLGGYLVVSVLGGWAVVQQTGWTSFLAFGVGVTVAIALTYLLLSWMLMIPVLVVEWSRSSSQSSHANDDWGTSVSYSSIHDNLKGPVLASVRRSMELTSGIRTSGSGGRRCYVFCALFCLWVTRALVAQLLHNIFVSNHNHTNTIPLANVLTPMGIFISFLPDILYLPLQSIVTMVLYISIRVDQEGLTPAILQRELGSMTMTMTTVQPPAGHGHGPSTTRRILSSSSYTAPTGSHYRPVALVEEADDDPSTTPQPQEDTEQPQQQQPSNAFSKNPNQQQQQQQQE